MKHHLIAAIIVGLAILAPVSGPAIGQEADEPDCANPVTQNDMNQCAYLDFTEADDELNAVWKKAKAYMIKQDQELKDMSPDLVGAEKALMKAQRAWIDYRDGQCEAYGFQSRGGSMEPMLVDGCKTEMTKARTKELKDLYEGSN